MGHVASVMTTPERSPKKQSGATSPYADPIKYDTTASDVTDNEEELCLTPGASPNGKSKDMRPFEMMRRISRNSSAFLSKEEGNSISDRNSPSTPKTSTSISSPRDFDTPRPPRSQKKYLFPSISTDEMDFRNVEAIDPKTSVLLSDKVRSMSEVLSKDKKVRQLFAQFIFENSWVELISYPSIMDHKLSEIEKPSLESVKFNQYDILSPRSRGNSMDETEDSFVSKMMVIQRLKINESKDMASQNPNYPARTCFHSEQMKSVLIACLMPLFHDSALYESWKNRASEKLILEDFDCSSDLTASASCSSTSSGAFAGTALGGISLATLAELRQEARKAVPNNRDNRLRDAFIRAARSLSEGPDLDVLLSSQMWMRNYLIAVEESKLSLTLSSASLDRPNFPMLYVNRSFEYLTNYRRSEAIGQNCKMLQCDRTEPGQVEKLGKALRRGEGVKLAVTNRRKDGSEFFNLLALRPVYTANGTYSFVAGVQYNVLKPDASMKEIKLVDDFLTIVANVLR